MKLSHLVLCASLFTALLAQDTVVVLVRHGEKVSEAADAELSETGLRRAESLARLLSPLQPSALFASDRKRTQQTLAPLAKAVGLQIQVRKVGEEAALAKHLLEAWKGRTTVVCGHSNTVGPLAAALGYRGYFPEPKSNDRYWIVRIDQTGAASMRDLAQPALLPDAR
jgi:phosphohistidine phosphatase SixA